LKKVNTSIGLSVFKELFPYDATYTKNPRIDWHHSFDQPISPKREDKSEVVDKWIRGSTSINLEEPSE
jgi:hypothetical protein